MLGNRAYIAETEIATAVHRRRNIADPEVDHRDVVDAGWFGCSSFYRR